MPDETQPDSPAEAARPDEEPPAAVAPEGPVAEAEERARKAENERKEAHDRMLRVAADFENFKRRARKEAEEAEARGKKSLLMAVLPTVDNLERALEAAGAGEGAASAIAEGVKLVLKQLLGTLDKFDVKMLPALGQAFDPSVHEAIQQVETSEAAAGTVIKELQKGYTMGGKLVRAAMVVVAKAPPAPPPTEAAGDDARPAAIEGEGEGEGEVVPIEVETEAASAGDGGAAKDGT